jgi:hypothetical protein
MRKSLDRTVFGGATVLTVILFVMVNFLGGEARAAGGCGCMDVALVVDDTGSMGPAIDNVKAELPAIIATAQAASCGDLRIGLVTTPSDNVVVNQRFTTVISNVQNAVQAIVAGSGTGGLGEPESTDAALQYVVTGAADPSCTVSNGPFGTFRPGCVKIAVVITDARPGGCDDTFIPGVDDVHAHNVAVAAANAGILISAIYVPIFGEASDIKATIRAIMQDYADTTGGVFVETASDGTGTGEGIADIIGTCGGISFQQCVTRTARFWFEHAFGTSASTNCVNLCVNLLDATRINGGQLNLGFVRLPTTFRNSDSVLDATDALMEALGFYWKSDGRTGEPDGRQGQKLGVSKLCKQRKLLARELIAATANVRLLGTKPANCTYFNGVTTTNFPADLLAQAREVARGEDPAACQTMTLLLRKFNQSGVTSDFTGNLLECSPTAKKTLRNISRDPTTQISCPGINENAPQAQAIVRFPFSQSVSLTSYTNDFPGLPCGIGGPDAVWKITPAIGIAGSRFTADTFGSNLDTVLSVWAGLTPTNLVAVSNGCNDNVPPYLQSQVSFTAFGSNTFYIVLSGYNGAVGRARIHVTSP